MHLSGNFENNSCPITDAVAWFLTPLDILYVKWCFNEDPDKLSDVPLSYINYFLFIFKWFQPSYNTLFHRANHTSCYISITIIWQWCGSIHRCFCLHPLKFLVFIIIHICNHILRCYWIKLPLFQLSEFLMPTLSWSLWDVHHQVTCCE